MTTVTMQFGDGTFKLFEAEADDPEKAVAETAEWVRDNAWFEVTDENGNELATTNLYNSRYS